MTQPPGSSRPPHLLRAYVEAVYEVDFASGQRRFRHGESAIGVPAFAIITGWNPGRRRPSRAENEARNDRLEWVLEDAGCCFVSARGYDSSRSHEEPSFAVLGMNLDEALQIARAFEQAAIFWFDGEIGRVVLTS